MLELEPARLYQLQRLPIVHHQQPMDSHSRLVVVKPLSLLGLMLALAQVPNFATQDTEQMEKFG